MGCVGAFLECGKVDVQKDIGGHTCQDCGPPRCVQRGRTTLGGVTSKVIGGTGAACNFVNPLLSVLDRKIREHERP